MSLTEYQERIINRFLVRCKDQRGGVIVIPAGLGKTYLASEMLKRIELKKVVIIPKSNELNWKKSTDLNIYCVEDLTNGKITKFDFKDCFVVIDNAEVIVDELRKIGKSKDIKKQTIALNIINQLKSAANVYLFATSLLQKDFLDLNILINLAAGKIVLTNNLLEFENKFTIKMEKSSLQKKAATGSRFIINTIDDLENKIKEKYSDYVKKIFKNKSEYLDYLPYAETAINTAKNVLTESISKSKESHERKIMNAENALHKLDKPKAPFVERSPSKLYEPEEYVKELLNLIVEKKIINENDSPTNTSYIYNSLIYSAPFLAFLYSGAKTVFKIIPDTFYEYKDYAFTAVNFITDYIIGKENNNIYLDKLVEYTSSYINYSDTITTNTSLGDLNYVIKKNTWDTFQLEILLNTFITKKTNINDIIFLNKISSVNDYRNYTGVTYKETKIDGNNFIYLGLSITNMSVDNYFFKPKRESIKDYLGNRMYYMELFLSDSLYDSKLKYKCLESPETRNIILNEYIELLLENSNIYKKEESYTELYEKLNEVINKEKQKLKQEIKKIDNTIKKKTEELNDIKNNISLVEKSKSNTGIFTRPPNKEQLKDHEKNKMKVKELEPIIEKLNQEKKHISL